MSDAIKSKGVSLAAIFDPYVAGTTKARASGIDDAGNDLSNLYANILYGSAAAATGIESEGADLNTLYAAKGTASYALPINGNTYSHAYSVTSGTGNSTIGFKVTGGTTYAVYGADSGHPAANLVSGAIPGGASTVQFIWSSYTVDAGDTDAGGATSNSASTQQPVSVDQDAHYTTGDFGALASTHDRNYVFTINFFNSSGDNISSTTINLKALIEGST